MTVKQAAAFLHTHLLAIIVITLLIAIAHKSELQLNSAITENVQLKAVIKNKLNYCKELSTDPTILKLFKPEDITGKGGVL